MVCGKLQRAAQVGALEIGVLQIRAIQHGAVEVRAAQVGTLQIGVYKYSGGELSVLQMSATEFAGLAVRLRAAPFDSRPRIRIFPPPVR